MQLRSATSTALRGELPDREAWRLALQKTVARGLRERDAIGVDRLDRASAEHQCAAGIHARGAALRVQAEQLGRRPAEPVRLSAELIDAGQRVRADRRPLRRGKIPAGRSVPGQVLDLVASGSDGGREVRHGRRGRLTALTRRGP